MQSRKSKRSGQRQITLMIRLRAIATAIAIIVYTMISAFLF